MRLEGRAYSPAVLEQIVTAGGAINSYEAAAVLLGSLAELEISARHVNNLTAMVGSELQQVCLEQTEAYRARPLPQQATRVEAPPSLACVAVDGGRMQTRRPDCGRGVHNASWRETKNAGFFRMKTATFADDPHPELPRCFTDCRHMASLLEGLQDDAEPEPTGAATGDPWRPQVLFRTCVSSLTDSDSFGWMMAAEADRRGFFAAEKRAFLGDGQKYNWMIHQARFSTFEPILDFIHPLEYLYPAARAACVDETAAWQTFQDWARLCWQGKVVDVVATLDQRLHERGPPPENADENDPRAVLARARTYLVNNQSRMDYPRYRREGLPITSCLIESLIKEVNYRVKGTEKFWNDGRQGEVILHVRAALLSHDDRLTRHLRARPGSPFARPREVTASTAA